MITDWKGNEIKPGMEVAFLTTVIHHMEAGILWPKPYVDNGKPGYQKIQDTHDESCWILSEFRKVEEHDGRLFVTIETKDGEYKYISRTYLGESSFFASEPPVLAIKGVSDVNPNK